MKGSVWNQSYHVCCIMLQHMWLLYALQYACFKILHRHICMILRSISCSHVLYSFMAVALVHCLSMTKYTFHFSGVDAAVTITIHYFTIKILLLSSQQWLTEIIESFEETIMPTMFWAEYWKWVADLPEEIQKYKPHCSRQHHVDVFAFWYWKSTGSTSLHLTIILHGNK